MQARVLRILIADDHEILRQGLRQLLEQKGWKVCGEAANGREAVNLSFILKPDVVILDLDMPELGGLEATRQIRKNQDGAAIVIFTMHRNEYLLQAAVDAGAYAVVSKDDGGEQLTNAVEELLRRPRRTYVPPRVSILTAREIEIARLLAEGKSNKQISALLGISPKTVETHRSTIMRKLNINSITQLVRYAIRNKLATP